MKIANRLYLLALLVVGLALLSHAAAVWVQHEVAGEIGQFVTQRGAARKPLREIETQVTQLLSAQVEAALLDDGADAAERARRLQGIALQLQAPVSRFREQFYPALAAEAPEQARAVQAALDAAVGWLRTFALLAESQGIEAVRLAYVRQGQPVSADVREAFSQLSEAYSRQVVQRLELRRLALNEASAGPLWVALGGLLSVALWLALIARQMTLRSHRIESALQFVGTRGDLAMRIRPSWGEDEFARFAQGFDQLLDLIEHDLAEARRSSESQIWVANGLAQFEAVAHVAGEPAQLRSTMLQQLRTYSGAEAAFLIEWRDGSAAWVDSVDPQHWAEDLPKLPSFQPTLAAAITSPERVQIRDIGEHGADAAAHAGDRRERRHPQPGTRTGSDDPASGADGSPSSTSGLELHRLGPFLALARLLTDDDVPRLLMLVHAFEPPQGLASYMRAASSSFAQGLQAAHARQAERQALDRLALALDDLALQRQQERERFELLVASIPDAMAITDAQGRVSYLNEALTRWLGYPAADLLGGPVARLFVDDEPICHVAERADAPPQPLIFKPVTLRHADGRALPAEYSLLTVRTADGPAYGLTFYDIAERLEREAQARWEAQLRQGLTEAVPDPLIIVDRERKVLLVNRAFETLFGLPLGQLQPKLARGHFEAFASMIDQPIERVIALQERCLLEGTSEHIELQVRTPTRGLRSMLLDMVPLQFAGQGRIAVISRFSDVTDLRTAEQELQSAHRLLESVASVVPIGLFQIEADEEGRLVFAFANARLPELLGVDRSLLLDSVPTALRHVAQAERGAFESRLRALLAHPAHSRAETLQLQRSAADGSSAWLDFGLVRADGTEAAGSRKPRLVGYVSDVTARREAEIAVQQQAAFMQQLIDSMPVVLVVKDAERRAIMVNREHALVHGVATSDMLGRRALEVPQLAQQLESGYGDDYDRIEREVIEQGVVRRSEFRWTDAAGRQRSFLTTRVPIELPGANRQRGLLLTSLEVTDLRRQEEDARRSHAQMQRIAGNVPGAIFEIRVEADGRAHVSYLSDGVEPLLGVTVEELYQDPFAYIDAVTEADRAPLRDFWHRLATRKPARDQVEFEIAHGDFKRQLLALATRSLDDADGASVFTGYLSDITDRVRAERARAFNLALLESVLRALPLPVYAKDMQLRYLIANQAFGDLMGAEASRFVGHTHEEMQLPERVVEGLTSVDNQLRQAALLAGGSEYALDRLFIGADGKERDMRWYYAPFDIGGTRQGLICISVDLTEERLAQREAERARAAAETARNRLVETTSSLPLVIFEAVSEPAPGERRRKRRWLFLSASIEQVLGVSADEAMADVDATFRQASRAERRRIDDWVTELEAQRPQHAEIDFAAELDGHERQFTMATRLVEVDPASDTLRWVGYVIDVTDERARERALRDAMAAAEEAAAVKSMFLANVSHEIRTPLNAMLGMTHLLQKTELTRRQRDYLVTIRNAGNTLLTLINDVLDFSKIEAGRMQVHPAAFDLADCIAGVAALHRERARQQGLRFIVDFDPRLPLALVGDATRIEQVLNNLCGNAVKFTERGSVTLAVRLLDGVGSTALGIEFAVTDTGIGMHPEQLARLFQPFVQGDGCTTRRFGGTGLGLSICQRLVELMGGRIDADSTPGVGSRFAFTLTLTAATAAERRSLVPALPPPRMRVLLLGGDDANLRLVRRQLAGLRVAVRRASALSADALASAAEGVGSIWVDHTWLGAGRSEPSDRFHAVLACADGRPIVALAASGDDEVIERLYGWGVAMVLPCPSGCSSIRAALETVRQQSERMRLPQSTPSARLQGLRILLAEDNAINRMLVGEMLGDAGCLVDHAEDGRRAIELLRGHAPDYYDLLLMDMHMPTMDGIEATRAIRGEPDWQHLPIVALTAGTDEDERAAFLAAGAQDFVGKPIAADRLIDTVARHARRTAALDRKQGLALDAATSPPPRALLQPDSSGPLLDRRVALRLLNGDERLYAALLQRFLRDLPARMQELRSALEDGHAEAALRAAHTLKGVAGNVGALSIFAIAAELEQAMRGAALQGAGAVPIGRAQWEPALSQLHTMAQRLLEQTAGAPGNTDDAAAAGPAAAPAADDLAAAASVTGERIERLAELLAQSDAAASELADQLGPDLGGLLDRDAARSFARALQAWDFAAAAQVLAQARTPPAV